MCTVAKTSGVEEKTLLQEIWHEESETDDVKTQQSFFLAYRGKGLLKFNILGFEH